MSEGVSMEPLHHPKTVERCTMDSSLGRSGKQGLLVVDNMLVQKALCLVSLASQTSTKKRIKAQNSYSDPSTDPDLKLTLDEVEVESLENWGSQTQRPAIVL